MNSENTSTETNAPSSQIEEDYTESLNTPPKVDDKYKKETIHTPTRETSKIEKGGLEEEKEKNTSNGGAPGSRVCVHR